MAAKTKSCVIAVDSEDKTPPSGHPCSMPKRSRVAICAPPGHGKMALVKNLLIRSRSDDQPWAAVVVVHQYCSKECGKKDWPAHKLHCQPAAKTKAKKTKKKTK